MALSECSKHFINNTLTASLQYFAMYHICKDVSDMRFSVACTVFTQKFSMRNFADMQKER